MIAENSAQRVPTTGTKVKNAAAAGVGVRRIGSIPIDQPVSAPSRRVSENDDAKPRRRAQERSEKKTRARSRRRPLFHIGSYAVYPFSLARLDSDDRFAAVSTMIMVVVCMAGMFFLGAYMHVAAQGRVLHDLRTEINFETALQHQLIADIAEKEAPNRIADEATKMGMVMGEKADYVTVRNSGVGAPKTDTVASAPALNQGKLGDN
jgi:hypothetical protein